MIGLLTVAVSVNILSFTSHKKLTFQGTFDVLSVNYTTWQ